MAPVARQHTPQVVSDYKSLYKKPRWGRLRQEIFERDHWTCQMEGCGKNYGHRPAMLVCDHKIPHRGNLRLFYDRDNLQTLCRRCHNSTKQKMEKAGNGW